jgi:hypothetical protein
MIINSNGFLIRQNDDLKFVMNSIDLGDDAKELGTVKCVDSKKLNII